MAHSGQGVHERLGPQALATARHHPMVELIDQGETGKHKIHPPGLIQSDAHVLYKMLYKKAGIELLPQNSRRQIVERPACRRTT